MTPETVRQLCRMMPNPLTVSYEVRNGTSFDAATNITYCEKRNPTQQDLVSAQAYLAGNQLLTWHMWAEKLGSIVPKEGDKFTYDSVTWYVKVVTSELLDQRYRLLCVKGT